MYAETYTQSWALHQYRWHYFACFAFFGGHFESRQGSDIKSYVAVSIIFRDSCALCGNIIYGLRSLDTLRW